MALGTNGGNYIVITCRQNERPTGLFGVLLSEQGDFQKDFHLADHDCQAPNPSVSFDGRNFLLVFERREQIFGMRISQSGDILDDPPEFAISSEAPRAGAHSHPVLAFNGTQYLVVWQRLDGDYDIVGAQVTTQGQVSEELPIFEATGEQALPSIASNGVDYFVVWRDTRTGSGPSGDSDIFGARVAGNGTVLDPEGLPVSTAQNLQDSPHVTFAGEHYLVVWMDERFSPFPNVPLGKLDVFARRIHPVGFILDGPVAVGGIEINLAGTNLTHQKVFPKAGFDGTNYLITWSYLGTSTDAPFSGVYAARLSTGGVLLDGPPTSLGIPIATPPGDFSNLVHPNILFSGKNQLLAWVQNSDETDIPKSLEGVLIHRISTESKDINVDTTADMIWQNTSSGETATWLMNSSGLRQQATFPGGVALEWTIRGFSDVNGDGPADLVWRNANGATAIWLMNPTGFHQSVTFTGGAGTGWNIMGVDDVNGDGLADIVWHHTNGATAIWLMNSRGLRQGVTFPGGVPVDWAIKGVGDVNGDGFADLVWRHTNRGDTAVWLMNASGMRQDVSFPGGAGLDWVIKGVGDINGNGFADLVWRNTDHGHTAVWLMNESALRQDVTLPGGVDLDWSIKEIGDVNGDGFADLVWRNTDRGDTAIWQMTSSGTLSEATFPGGADLIWELRP